VTDGTQTRASRRSRRRGRTTAIGVLVGLVVVVGGVALYLGPVAPIATGYAAKISCSGVFVSGRSLEDVQGDLPDNPLVPFLRVRADEAAGELRASLLGLWPSSAFHTPGLGCTLAEARPAFASPPSVVHAEPDVPWPVGDGPVPALPGDVDAATLDAAIATAFTEDDPDDRRRNTRAVVVARDGELLAERYGDGFDADTPLLGWSMAKSVANALIGHAVLEGLLTVDQQVLRPGWEDDARADITLEHLLTMTDGLAFEEVYDPGTDATQMLFTPEDTGAYGAAQPLVHPPGSVWSYSSGTTNLLCDVAQEATGLGVELAHEVVFAPLGMTSAVLEPDASGGLVCSSFLYATARDWARFGQLYLDDGVWQGERLLPEGWVAASVTPVAEATDTPYGYQWWLNQGPNGTLRMPSVPEDAFWASGNEGQQVVVLPSQGLVVVRLGFSGAFSGVEWGLEPMLAGIVEAVG
jgi:CubicO group peptidase (beta-lactamase class C family)